ncbi:3'-5' exonuclease [Berryella wangjianweii]|uniref:3'-5' exonuclease n=1 Tax=Berryella wangjianweii TaxID=2734634 RepID=A0A6M8J7T1_9ACTN|nr:3'-5' exonuclease [Berryella wangjianweii]QKF07459.1 3'-5' exonuclease [Berryella wangjianweii]
MNIDQALEHANAFAFPDLLLGFGDEAIEAECAKNEEAIKALVEAFFAQENPSFGFDLVLDLADRNRDLADQLDTDRVERMRGINLARGLSDADQIRAISKLQRRRIETIEKETIQRRQPIATAYAGAGMRGTVVGIDIETTSRHPDRGYIINVGWELMELAADAEPYDAQSVFCGIPEVYREKGVPLTHIHQITWDEVGDQLPLRQNPALQAQILKVLESHPYLAHNASFEDSWFLLNIKGYAEARKAGKIVPVDTRDICRSLDREAQFLPFDAKPAALENWARRRGTLAPDQKERHLGLDDADLMLRTVREEVALRGLFK